MIDHSDKEKLKEYLENIFNTILEFNKIYKNKYKNNPNKLRSSRDEMRDIVYNLLIEKETTLNEKLDKSYSLIEGIFSITEYIMSALYKADTYNNCEKVEEWRQDFDTISIRKSAFTHLIGSLQNSSALRVVCGDVYMAEKQRGLSLVNPNPKEKVTTVDGSLLTLATLADNIKVVEVNGSFASFIENVRSWLAFFSSYMAKVTATHSIAVYDVNILHDTTIRLKPIEVDFINVRKISALVESLMRPSPLVGYDTGRFFDFFEEVLQLYDKGLDWDREGLDKIYREAGYVVNKYVNRFLGRDARISLLGLNVSALAGDLRIILSRESMSILSIYCPANIFLEIDGDKVMCEETSYALIKPPRPWSTENNSITFIKLYIDIAVGKPSIKILFK